MTTYNTGNPIGSKDPRDLYDNAENLDEAVNTRQAESWDDRFGVARKTWWGMEQEFNADQDDREDRFSAFLASSGYQQLGDYAAGLEITEYNQIFRHDGEWWRADASLDLPYTTTGDWATEGGNFVSVGDAALRSELASPTGTDYVYYQNNKLTDYLSSVSVTAFGAVGDYDPTTGMGTDDSDAFIAAVDKPWVTFPDPTSIVTGTNFSPFNKIFIPARKYLITKTIPLVSFLHLEFEDGAEIHFRPTSQIPLFSTDLNKMHQAFLDGHTNWKDMTCYGVKFSGAGILRGNMTRTSSVHAGHAIMGANFHRSYIERLTIEGFDTGIEIFPYDNSSWTGGGRTGNFYENIVENVSILDCTNIFINRGNLTTLINGRFGNETLRKTDPNAGDYVIENTGAGFTAINIDIANIARPMNTKIAHIYDMCHGSSYTGYYSEYFDVLFLLDPTISRRFTGFTADAGHTFKERSTDVYVKFADGFMPYYDLQTDERGGVNLRGPFNNIDLISLSYSFANSSANLLTDFFEMAPQYDFKYGLYGVAISQGAAVPVDIKRFESKETGFLSQYGARFVCTDDIDILFPIKNNRYEAFVCILYRNITGSFSPSQFVLNQSVAEGNKYISVGSDVYDYGNGWKMAVVKNARLNINESAPFRIQLKVGDQIEIEHIGAYAGGYPIFPTFQDYRPKINGDGFFFSIANNYLNSGGLLGVGDMTEPYIPVISGSVNDTQPIKFSYCKERGSNVSTFRNSGYYSTFENATVNFTDNVFESYVLGNNGLRFSQVLGVGQFVEFKRGSTTLPDVNIVERIYDKSTGRFTTRLRIDRDVFNGSAELSIRNSKKPVMVDI